MSTGISVDIAIPFAAFSAIVFLKTTMNLGPRSRCYTLLALCLISLANALAAQVQQAPQQRSSSNVAAASPELLHQLELVKSAALSDDYAYEQLAHLTENIGPRPAGSPAAQAAVDYVAAQMRELGLEVHLESCKVRHWIRGIETAELFDYAGRTPGTQQKIVLTALGGSTSTGADGISAEIVVVNDFDQLKTFGRDRVAGKIVLFEHKFDKQKAKAGLGFSAYREMVPYRETGPESASHLGAVAALVRSIGGADYRLPHTGDSDPAGIPTAAITAEDADLIVHLAAEGPVRMHLTLTPQKLPDEVSYNVIGDLKGSEHPEQIVDCFRPSRLCGILAHRRDRRRGRCGHGDGNGAVAATLASASQAHAARHYLDGRGNGRRGQH